MFNYFTNLFSSSPPQIETKRIKEEDKLLAKTIKTLERLNTKINTNRSLIRGLRQNSANIAQKMSLMSIKEEDKVKGCQLIKSCTEAVDNLKKENKELKEKYKSHLERYQIEKNWYILG